MHVVDEPYLMGMRKMVMKLRWKPGLSGFYENMPDGGATELLIHILELRKTPASQTWILAMLVYDSRLDILSDFAMYAMRSRGAILVCMIFFIA
jgi:hypothetical protein